MPEPLPPPPFPEVIVRGGRLIRPGVGPGRGDILEPDPVIPVPREAALLPGAFLSPGLAPAIEEIVVTAPRSAARPPVATRALGGSNPFGFIAVTLGFLTAKIVEELSQQALDRKFEELMADGRFRPNETPLNVEPQPIPEIVVTARAPDLFAPLTLPPEPVFIPFETDPFIMQPITPRILPDVATPQIDVEIPTPTAPQVRPAPTRSPTRRPGRVRPETQPSVRPDIRPARQPFPFQTPVPIPQPFAQPFATPASQPLTRISRSVRPSTRSRAQPRTGLQPFAQSSQRSRLCPPCTPAKTKKKKKKRRATCYKKLVSERRNPAKDKIFKWQRIDCRTGREL